MRSRAAIVCLSIWPLSSCAFGALDLEGRSCPCIEGYYCADAGAGQGRCVSSALDAGPRRDAGRDPRDAGIDAPIARDGGSELDALAPSDGGPDVIPIIVAISRDRLVSIDEGLTWCAVGETLPSSNGWMGAYGDGVFIAVSFEETSSRSLDGHGWSSPVALPNGYWLADIEFGNDIWIAAGGCGSMSRSRDGRAWENLARVVPEQCVPIESLAFGDGRFVAGTRKGEWYTSADGLAWELERAGRSAYVTYRDGDFHDRETPWIWRGRGICLSHRDGEIVRSTEADCSFLSVITAHEEPIREFVFGEARADEYTRAMVPTELADCLGL